MFVAVYSQGNRKPNLDSTYFLVIAETRFVVLLRCLLYCLQLIMVCISLQVADTTGHRR